MALVQGWRFKLRQESITAQPEGVAPPYDAVHEP
jgi:hypothetical protein